MIGAVIIFTASVVFSMIAVALMLKLSHKYSWYDHIDERKIHRGDIPRLGGAGFALVFIGIAAAISFSTRKFDHTLRFLPCLAALIFALGFGIWDDFRPMASWYKLLLQFLASLCVVVPGYVFKRITYTDLGPLANLGWLGYPLTCLWIVGLANAINFIDGVDGLAGGLGALIAFFFGLIFYFYAETPAAELFCVSLCGVMLGFLVFNAPMPRAKIFMGDCGSQFLGFTLALLPLLEEHNTRAALPVPYAAALLAIPIFDTVAAVWRRVRDGKRVDSPDMSHLHHKLMNLGLSPRKVNAVLYGLQIILGVLTFVSIRFEGWSSAGILGIAYAGTAVFFAVVHFLNRKAVASLRKIRAETPAE